jgi:hypothetical protein
MVDSALVPLESKTVSFNSPQVQTSFVTPSTLTTGLALLRLYAADEMAWPLPWRCSMVRDRLPGGFRDHSADGSGFVVRGRAHRRPGAVSLRDLPTVRASLNMTARSDGWFVSAAYPVTPLTSVVQFQIIIQDNPAVVRTPADVPADDQKHRRPLPGSQRGGLGRKRGADVDRAGQQPGHRNAKGLYLRLEEADSLSQSFKTVAMDTLSCAALSSRQVALPYSPAPGVRLVRLVLDSDRDGANGWITQSLFPLQSQAFAYDPKSGIAGGDTLHFDQALTVAMPAGVFSTPAVLHVRRSMQPLLFDQTDLTLSGASYTIAFSTTEKPQKPITISLPCDPDAPAAPTALPLRRKNGADSTAGCPIAE